MRHHLAQVNVAHMRDDPAAPSMASMVSRIEEMNRLADQSPGFVWRLPGSDATPAALAALSGCVAPFDPGLLFYNMSVWESVEDLRRYVFRTAHAEMLRGRHRWVEPIRPVSLALWWVPAGHRPSVAESADKLRSLRDRGPSPDAFTFAKPFPPPAPADLRMRT